MIERLSPNQLELAEVIREMSFRRYKLIDVYNTGLDWVTRWERIT
jgi:hypothetical protein